jgi:hypothetical protein
VPNRRLRRLRTTLGGCSRGSCARARPIVELNLDQSLRSQISGKPSVTAISGDSGSSAASPLDFSASGPHRGAVQTTARCESSAKCAAGIQFALAAVPKRDSLSPWNWPGTVTDADIAAQNSASRLGTPAFLCEGCAQHALRRAARARLVEAVAATLLAVLFIAIRHPPLAVTASLATMICWYLFVRSPTLADRCAGISIESLEVLGKAVRRRRVKTGREGSTSTT